MTGVESSGAPQVRLAWLIGAATETAALTPTDADGAYSAELAVPDALETVPLSQSGNQEQLWISDAATGQTGTAQFVANDFTFYVATHITSISWQGGYANDPEIPSADDFKLQILADGNGLPAAVLYEENIGNAGRTATGHSISTGTTEVREFTYRATLVTPFDAEAGVRYWLAISNNTTTLSAHWGWEDSYEGNESAAIRQTGGSWQVVPIETAFSLQSEAKTAQICAAPIASSSAQFACAEFTLEAPGAGAVEGTIPVTGQRGGFAAEINLYNAVGRRVASAPIDANGYFGINDVPPGTYYAGVTGNVPSLISGAEVNISTGGASIVDLPLLEDGGCAYGAWIDWRGGMTATPTHDLPREDRRYFDGAGNFLSLGAAAEDRVDVTFTARLQTAVGVNLEWVHFHIEKADGGTIHIGSLPGHPGQRDYSVTYNVSQLPHDGIVPGGGNWLRIAPLTDEGPTPACRLAYYRIRVLRNPFDDPLIRDGVVSWNGPRNRYDFSGKIPELAGWLPAIWPDPPPEIPLLGPIENSLDAYVSFAGNLELDGDLRVSSLRARAEALLLSQEVFDPIDEAILPPGVEDVVFDIFDIRHTRVPFGPVNLASFDEDYPVFSGPLFTFLGLVTLNASVSLGIRGDLDLRGEVKPLLPGASATLTAEAIPSLTLSAWVDLLAVVAAGGDAIGEVLFGLPLQINTERAPPVWFDDPCMGFKVILEIWVRAGICPFCHTWDLASEELFCEENGDCGFCDARSGRSTSGAPEVMAAPAVAAGAGGRMLSVYTENTTPGEPLPTIQVLARFWDPTQNEWGPASAITDGSAFVMDAVPAFVGPDGHAIVAYTENPLTVAEQEALADNLPARLAFQEIFAAYWDGTSWTTTRLTDDLLADGRAAIAGDAEGATLAWTRDDGDGNITTRGDLRIAVRNFDYTTGMWDAMQTLAAQPSNYQVSVARYNEYAMLAWSTDGDGDPNTNSDRFIALAGGFPGGGWTVDVPSALPSGAELPSVALNPSTYWIELAMSVRGKDGDGVTDTGAFTDQATLAFARRDAMGFWQSAPLLDNGQPIRAERPRLAVSEQGESLLLFRRFGQAGTNAAIGQLALMRKAPGAAVFSAPLYVTDENRQHWQQSLAVNSAGQAAVCSVSRAPIGSSEGTIGVAPLPATPARVFAAQQLADGNDPVESFVIVPGADPALTQDLTASETHAAPGKTVLVSADVRNTGRAQVSGLSVNFYTGTPETGTLLGVVSVPGPVGFNESVPVSLQVVRIAGPQEITAEVISANDTDSTNNRATVDLGELHAPTVVTAAASQLQANALKLRWLPPPVYGVAGYRVLRSDTSGGPYEFVGESSIPIYRDLLLEIGRPYYYVVQAFDADCVLSPYSAEVAATAVGPCPFTCGDIDGSGGPIDLGDFAEFASCFGLDALQAPACLCADLNGDGATNLEDFAIFAGLLGTTSANTPPICE